MKIVKDYVDVIFAIGLILIVPLIHVSDWIIYLFMNTGILTELYGIQYEIRTEVSYILCLVIINVALFEVLEQTSVFKKWRGKNTFTKWHYYLLVALVALIIFQGMITLYQWLL